MRIAFALWVLLYGVVAVVSMPFFARIAYARELGKYPRLLDEDESSGKVAAKKREAVFAGMLQGLSWPVALLVLVISAALEGFSFKLPKSMEKERERQRNRKIIEDFGKEEGL